MKWFFPSWNGDFRLEPDGEIDAYRKTASGTALVMVQPTAYEQKLLEQLAVLFRARGWWTGEKLWVAEKKWLGRKTTQRVSIGAPLSEVGPAVAELLKSGEQTLTAVRFENGTVETVRGTRTPALSKLIEKAQKPAPPKPPTPPKPPKPPKPGPIERVAASLKRATLSCPECHAGAVGPATEVLLAFLTEEQHADWARERFLVCYGELSGHAYLLAHRHTPLARRMGRICFDLDDETVLHFHDMGVPPEEEVLAAKLMLEHAEPWLRNEASLLGTGRRSNVYKNPFGDGMDGIWDAGVVHTVGAMFR